MITVDCLILIYSQRDVNSLSQAKKGAVPRVLTLILTSFQWVLCQGDPL